MKFKEFLGLSETDTGDIQSTQSKLNLYTDNTDYSDEVELEDIVQVIQQFWESSDDEIAEMHDSIMTEFEEDEETTPSLESLVELVLELFTDEDLDADDILDILGVEDVIDPSDEVIQDILEYIMEYLDLGDSEDEDSDFSQIFPEMWRSLYGDDLQESYVSIQSNLNEAVTARFLTKNINRKKRKFMQKSRAQLNRERTKRRQENRIKKTKRKQHYRKNKNRIKQYTQQYTKIVKKGVHKKKLRRRAGTAV